MAGIRHRASPALEFAAELGDAQMAKFWAAWPLAVAAGVCCGGP